MLLSLILKEFLLLWWKISLDFPLSDHLTFSLYSKMKTLLAPHQKGSEEGCWCYRALFLSVAKASIMLSSFHAFQHAKRKVIRFFAQLDFISSNWIFWSILLHIQKIKLHTASKSALKICFWTWSPQWRSIKGTVQYIDNHYIPLKYKGLNYISMYIYMNWTKAVLYWKLLNFPAS